MQYATRWLRLLSCVCKRNVCQLLIEKCGSKMPKGFQRLRRFPKTLGALDGKHIAITKPENSGSSFFNYKKFYSIVLLAIADAESRFLVVDVGAAGRNSDANLWMSSGMRTFLESPIADLQPNYEGMLPYLFLGDGGFGCTDLIMTPFTDKGADTQIKISFSTRLSKARIAIEHAGSLHKCGDIVVIVVIETQYDFIGKV